MHDFAKQPGVEAGVKFDLGRTDAKDERRALSLVDHGQRNKVCRRGWRGGDGRAGRRAFPGFVEPVFHLIDRAVVGRAPGFQGQAAGPVLGDTRMPLLP
jgi:hypothetical protein